MNGWNTNHQEFTSAKGDPLTIKQLISQFKLDGIVSFDLTNSLITTTIQHDKYIRLSDLLMLNFQQVIVFTLPQYIQVIRQLFELLQGMKELKFQHGDLRMENILLDLSESYDKLDNKPIDILFQLKLINFAEFYNLQKEDDFERAFTLYRQIMEYFPQFQNELDLKNKYEIKKDQIFLNNLQEQINELSKQLIIDEQQYSWDSNYLDLFIKNYKSQEQNLINFNQVNFYISQLHQYHLIVNHYPKLNYSYLHFFNKFKIQSEPQNFELAVSKLNQLLDYNNLMKKIDFQYLVDEQSLDKVINQYQFSIDDKLLCYLKKQGYLENIHKFVELIQNKEQISDFNKYIFFESLLMYSNIWNLQNIELPQEILKIYTKSQFILKTIVQIQIFELKVNAIESEKYEFQEKIDLVTNNLQEKLENIKTIGQKYSNLLINQCIRKNLGMQLKYNSEPIVQPFIYYIVQSWLSWIDQYIFNQQYSNIDDLRLIQKAQFIQFIQEKGFKLIQKEMKKYIEIQVEQIFKKINN